MPNTKLSTPVAATAQNNPGIEPRLISAVSADGAAPQFNIPFSSQAIQSVESVDLDLVLTTATGEKIILQQGALQAATQPDSKIVFQNGDSITAADQIKKLGILKPVEGGSFRLKSGDASPAVAEKVTGDAFGLGKELQDTMSQLTETSKQLEKVLQTLTTASLSTTTDDAKPITAGPSTGTGVQKITSQSDKFASPSPGSPPKLEVEEFTSNNTSNNTNNNTSNNTDSGNVSNIKITSTLRGLYGAPDAITTHVRAVDKIQSKEQGKEVLKAFSQASLREMLPSDPLEVRISGSTPVALEPNGLAHNTLVMPGVLNAKSIRFELPQDTVLPAGFQIAGQTFSGSRITIAAESLKDLSLAIQWKVADLDASITKTDFQLGVKYLDDKGAELEQGRAPLTFTYGELKTIEDTVQLDANSNTKIFLSAYGYNYDILGDDSNNNVAAGNGNDTLDGGAGADVMAGGAGHDTYVVDNTGDVVTEAANAGIDLLKASVSYTLSANVENLTLTGSGDINGTGNELANNITGNSGNNTLDGGLEADTLVGGAGNDTYIVDNTGDVVSEESGAESGTDLIKASVTYTLSAHVENLELTGTYNLGGTGNDLNNTITGNSGNNTLDGGAGADIMIGGAGNDTYIVESASDVVDEVANEGTDTVQSSVNYTLGDNLENLTLTGTATSGTGNTSNNVLIANNNGNSLSGLGGNDTLTGGTGNDTLDGGAGTDSMAGGSGDDTYIVESASDVVDEVANEGTDTVQSSVNYTLGDNLENLTLTGGATSGTGNISNNVLIANNNGNSLSGLSGDDTLTGGTGNDTLDGGAGTDSMVGGSGDDTYILDNAKDVVSEVSGAGTDTVQSSVNYTLGDNLENLTLSGGATSGAGNISNNVLIANNNGNSLSGLSGDDTLTGGTGKDTLDGGEGTDSMAGGSGDDTYIVDNAKDVVTEASGVGTGSDTVQSSVNYTLGVNLENLTLTGTATSGTGNTSNNVLIANNNGNSLSGLSGDDTLTGGTGKDTLDGGEGTDSMAGGSGDDTYIVDNAKDVVTEASAAGTDTVQSSINYTLGVNLENLTLTGTATSGAGNGADNIIIGNNAGVMLDGGAGNDNITGGTGNDTLIGGVGSDILTGGGGTDTVSYSASSGAVLVSLATGVGSGGDASDDSLIGITNLIGSSGADTLTGDAGNNYLTGNGSNDTLSGGDGNDTLDGGAGNDSMTGGTGNDTYIVDSTTDVVTEAANAGTDTVQSSVNYTLGRDLENLTLRDTASAGVGNELDNIIIGSNTASILDGKSGNDSITGGTSNDILTGGLGNDTLDGGVGSDWVDYSAATNNMTVELKASGTSTISFLINTVDQGTDTLSNIENIKTGSGNDAVTATGTATTANTIYSGAGDDTVSGGDGNNTLYGEAGNDNLTAGSGNDAIFGGDGNDVIAGGNGSNALYGEAGNDTLTAGAGNDTIFGGDGNDSITGGGGADSLLAGDGVDTLTGGAGVDTFDLAMGNKSLAGDKATSGGAADVFIVNADNLASINSSTLIQGTSAAVDTLQIKATAGATINLTALTNTDNFVSINKVDVATDGVASTIQFNSASVKNLVDGGNESVLTLALGGSDNYTIMSEQGVYVTDTRASATFYSDAAKTVQIAQVLYV